MTILILRKMGANPLSYLDESIASMKLMDAYELRTRVNYRFRLLMFFKSIPPSCDHHSAALHQVAVMEEMTVSIASFL